MKSNLKMQQPHHLYRNLKTSNFNKLWVN